MTTSVGNNSVFRSFFEKQKITGPNFINWYRQLCLVLSTKYKENYLEHPIPEAPVAPPGQQVPHELKAMISKQAEQELLQTMREFHTRKREEGQVVSSYVLKMKGYIDNLERLCNTPKLGRSGILDPGRVTSWINNTRYILN
nr:zinc finger, CCHC-type [Tanacetum cinerariifolium]